jgi:hypothetical protein
MRHRVGRSISQQRAQLPDARNEFQIKDVAPSPEHAEIFGMQQLDGFLIRRSVNYNRTQLGQIKGWITQTLARPQV